MPGILSKGKFRDYLGDLDALILWLSRNDAKVSATRVAMYRKSLATLIETARDKNDEVMSGRFPEFANTLYEVHELLNIYDGLGNVEVTAPLKAALCTLVAGPVEYDTENSSSSNRPRNMAFELILTSKLRDAGFDAEIGAKADIEFQIKDRPIFVECKRPQTPQSVLSNAKKANSQLKRRFSSARSIGARGFLAVDITKALVESSQVLVYSDERDIKRILDATIDGFHNEFSAEIRKRWGKKMLGIFLRVSTMAMPKNLAGSMVYCQHYGFIRRAGLSSSDSLLLDSLERALNALVAA